MDIVNTTESDLKSWQLQAEDRTYGDLTNWRCRVSQEHKTKVMSGYSKIMNFIHMGMYKQAKDIQQSRGVK